jgi:hypothetical protein
MKNLDQFIHDTEDPNVNFALGQEYESIGQTGSAISFYLRTAERSSDDLQQYHALLRMALCFERQKTRDDTESVILQKAIGLLPHRPEAYFLLSRLYEWQKRWHESYFVASVGCSVSKFDSPPLSTDVQYPGEYALMFQKAVALWWVGNCDESRELMYHLKVTYDMNEMFARAVNNNLNNLGYPFTHTPYEQTKHSQLRYKFLGSENIVKNFSQSFQDMFVLAATNGKSNGTYLEIGSAEPFKGNNTALLETQFGWRGLSVDIDQRKVEQFLSERNNWVLCVDATKIDYAKILDSFGIGTTIDYLQVDCDPPEVTFEILKKIPFDSYRFAVITFEHDFYVNSTIKEMSRNYLRQQGYELVVSDVAYNKIHSYEDWWVHPELVERSIIDKLSDTSGKIKYAPDYMLPQSTTVKAQDQPTGQFSAPIIRCDKVNAQYQPGVWIVDNFLVDPDSVREFALAQHYQTNNDGEKGYIGRRTTHQYLWPGLKEEFERIIGRKITRWEDHGMNGRFQTAQAGDPLVYHCDLQKWAGMLYLTPNAPYQCGTSTWARKGTDIRDRFHPQISTCFHPESRNFDRTIFEPVDVFGNVYNRLVIFNASYLHSASEYFGFNQENSRLWQMFFFD